MRTQSGFGSLARAGSWRRVSVMIALAVTSFSARAGTCNPTAALAALQGPTSDKAYQAVKQVEGCFQLPTPQLSVPVTVLLPNGTVGYSPNSVVQALPPQPTQPPDTGGAHAGGVTKPVVDHTVYPAQKVTLGANAVNVTLIFQRPGPGPFSVTLRGMEGGSMGSAQAAANQSTIAMNIGTASQAVWVEGLAEIDVVRPPVIGVGAFTLPAIPLGIAYGVPQSSASVHNVNVVTLTNSIATSTKSDFAQMNGVKAPGDVSWLDPSTMWFEVPDVWKGVAKAASGLGDATGNMYLKVIGQGVSIGMQVVQGALGSVSQTISQSTTITQSRTLTVSDSRTEQLASGQTNGPGFDDAFMYLYNVKAMWIATATGVKLSVLSYDIGVKSGLALLQVKDVPTPQFCTQTSDGVSHCLQPGAAKTLLALNPFTAPLVNVPFQNGVTIPFSQPSVLARFNDCQLFDLTGIPGPFQIGGNHTVSQQDQLTTATANQVVTDSTAGWLAAAGPVANPAVMSTQTQTTSVTNTVSTGTTVQTSINDGTTFAPPPATFAVQRCFDPVFATFAYLPVQTTPMAMFQAHAIDHTGRAAAGQRVTLDIAGRRYVTVADVNGNYAFHVAGMPAGNAVVTVDGRPQAIVVPNAPLLQLPPQPRPLIPPR